MPTIGGASGIGWDEGSPPATEGAGNGFARIQSVKSSVRQGLDAEHNWPSAGGNNIGYHAFGSARPYYGTQSAVSSSGSDGRLMQASDTSRLFGVGSGGTTYLGGPLGLSIGTTAGFTFPQRHIWVEEVGVGVTGSTGSVTVTFPSSGFSGVPYTFIQGCAPVSGGNVLFSVGTVDGASVIVSSIAASVFFANAAFFWRSLGTRVL